MSKKRALESLPDFIYVFARKQGANPILRSSPMLDSTRNVVYLDAKDMMAQASIEHVRTLLTTCLAQLDALNAQVAAAHLSACLDVLQQDFKSD
jgi:hypothetical protein